MWPGHVQRDVIGQELPFVGSIQYQMRQGNYSGLPGWSVCVVASGKVYDKKELLKAVGFKWNKDNKNWYKELTH